MLEGKMADEKFDEKEREKREEKSPEEKSWEEKYRRDPLGSITWAVILIWAGIVFLLDNLGVLYQFTIAGESIPGLGFLVGLEAWSLILIGAGVILLIEVVIRLLIPEYRRPVGGNLFFGIFLIAIGLGQLIGWVIIWPLILIALGLSLVIRSFLRRA
jgi:hypothetical protein